MSSDCADGRDCRDGVCVTLKENGEACGEAGECRSGFCPADDGVCCDAECSGTCESCFGFKTGAEHGSCAPVIARFDPDLECNAEGVSSCGATGEGCNGDAESPGCIVHAEGTPCSAESCSDGVLMPARSCDGAGTCALAVGTSCAPYSCDEIGGVCRASCSSHDDCAEDHYCSVSSCVVKKAPGVSCSAGFECGSGFCPEDDGVCCDVECGDTCEACLGSKTGESDGFCAPVSDGLDPDGECLTISVCNGAGVCSL